MISPEHKREYDRLNHSLVVRFRIYRGKETENPSCWDMVTIRNLSAGGVSFNYTKNIPPETVLEFNIGLAKYGLLVRCLGVVRRVDEIPPSRTDMKAIRIYGVACNFTHIEENDKKALDGLVKEFNKKA